MSVYNENEYDFWNLFRMLFINLQAEVYQNGTSRYMYLSYPIFTEFPFFSDASGSILEVEELKFSSNLVKLCNSNLTQS